MKKIFNLDGPYAFKDIRGDEIERVAYIVCGFSSGVGFVWLPEFSFNGTKYLEEYCLAQFNDSSKEDYLKYWTTDGRYHYAN